MAKSSARIVLITDDTGVDPSQQLVARVFRRVIAVPFDLADVDFGVLGELDVDPE